MELNELREMAKAAILALTKEERETLLALLEQAGKMVQSA